MKPQFKIVKSNNKYMIGSIFNCNEKNELPIGEYVIELLKFEDFSSKKFVSVEVKENETTTKEIEYEKIGYVQSSITPNTYDLRWKLRNTTIWYTKKDILTLPIGSYEIEFENFEDEQLPLIVVQIYADKTTYAHMNLHSSILSIDTKHQNGRWRIKNTNRWYENNYELHVRQNMYNIEFIDIHGYQKPKDVFINLNNVEYRKIVVEYNKI